MNGPGNDDETQLTSGDETVLSSDDQTVLSPLSAPAATGREGPRLEPGQAFGPYRIGRLLGRGGMGEVYEAEHLETGRRVALKLLRSRIDQREDRARFLREGQLAASISHPHTVYIFGSEEIDGLPVISMELLPGGTLKDRVVERGPMPAGDAAAAVLDIIGGLDAAESVGILHRDIKPSNCFVDTDGSIKVGDFGLSISTLARDVRAGGSSGFEGTPQFAPPEQLRGEPLDVRADIYAVGATLFYLLTGKPPFESPDMHELTTRVKSEPATLANKLVPSVPAALAAVVQRCLAKDPASRPASYAALATLLKPFAGQNMPARPGQRLVAGLIDSFIIATPLWILNAMNVTVQSSRNAQGGLENGPWAVLLSLLYFSITESVWRKSLGKRVMGLEVVSTSGPLSWKQATARALCYQFASLPLPLSVLFLGSERVVAFLTAHPAWAALVGIGPLLFNMSLFLTMRRRNGMAALHDLITRTRIVTKRYVELRRGESEPAAIAADKPVPGEHRRRFGPFEAAHRLGAIPGGELLEGFDTLLRRRVWIVVVAAGTPAVPTARRDAGRVGRLRWLAGQRSVQASEASGGGIDSNWDAFEAPSGAPLGAGKQPWSSVKRWLTDLFDEIAAATADGSLSGLALDRVWIRGDGRAVLLDFPGPGANTTDRDEKPPAALLAAVGRHASSTTASPMPVSAVAMLDAWTRKPATPLDAIRKDLVGVGMAAEQVTRGRRLVPLLITAMPVLLFTIGGLAIAPLIARGLSPESLTMLEFLDDLEKEKDPAVKQALETYLAGVVGPRLTNNAEWKPLESGKGKDIARLRALAKQIAEKPAPTPEQIAAATVVLEPKLKEIRKNSASAPGRTTMIIVVLFLIGCGVSMFFGTVSALARRSGVLMSSLGLAIVGPKGREASRFRCVLRLIAAWLPVIVCFLLFLPGPGASIRRQAVMTGIAPAAAAAILLAGLIWTILRPSRGPHDILARTTVGVR